MYLLLIVLLLIIIFFVSHAECGCSGCKALAYMNGIYDNICARTAASETIIGGETGKEGLANPQRIVTLHAVSWCPYCKTMKPIWERVKKYDTGNVIFRELDEDVAKTPGVTGYPTIRMTTETGRTIEYKGTADFDSLRSWIATPNP